MTNPAPHAPNAEPMDAEAPEQASARRVALLAGGTLGHMMPAAALADALRARGVEVSLVTDPRGARFPVMTDLPRMVLNAHSHMGGGLIGKTRAVWSVFTSLVQVRRAWITTPVDAVVGFGGYPTMPGLLAARTRAIPAMVHEQNAVLGRVNRWMAPKTAGVALGLPDTRRVPLGVPTLATGNPVGGAVARLADRPYPVPKGTGPVRLMVLGGSQGARILSDVVPTALSRLDDSLRQRLNVVHQARPEDVARVEGTYTAAGIDADVRAFFQDVPERLADTHLVICRAGASTLAEVTALGRPAILVPLRVAADDHQRFNAERLVRAGGGWMLTEDAFTADALVHRVADLIAAPDILARAATASASLAAPDAASKLADMTETLIQRGRIT
ncbi:undecaprenyldiphospho-muramoylpentapeptide beta-N-acetylglucosaminyltransferase [Yunchengibacter salinarum]|uniref:undecaprenyldiphospho-muramoylpentapeptide beta-N-acetylglucosaminyltransferase n=1 Tax=Yunchengibacter salinarum TaxID=3133399 RepID=UPI0035B5E6F0